jgi:hypothetical protein
LPGVGDFCVLIRVDGSELTFPQLTNIMTKIIFDCETEVGKCDYEPSEHFRYAEPHYSTIYAHTLASLNGGLMKIEQHCYLRNGGDLPEQPWVRPQITLEPALGTEREMIELAKAMHEQFVDRTRRHNPEQFAASVP